MHKLEFSVAAAFGLALGVGSLVDQPGTALSQPQGVEALQAIVGTWQSDTVSGTSALSTCAWTPVHSAVVCEQTSTMPAGVRHSLSLFTFDPLDRKYLFYALGKPGDPMHPVPLAISGRIWIYGGLTAGPDSTRYRTVNDFSATGTYLWRQESSKDGEKWVAGIHGQSRRLP